MGSLPVVPGHRPHAQEQSPLRSAPYFGLNARSPMTDERPKGNSIGHLCAVLLCLHLFRRSSWSVMLHMLHMLTFLLSFGLRRGLQAGIAFCRAIGGRHHDHRLSCIHPLPLPRQGLRCLRRCTRRSGRALRESAGYHTRPRPTRAGDGSCGTSRRSPASHPRRPKSRESTVRLPCFAPRRTGLSNLARSTSTFPGARRL